mmetsp:Transcript_22630/g.63002  ORF Transcript_22630/g.63002 Transcript_22630/m.63002 type:complete len:304 (-) Transcript_22630:444-1355(-)
MRRTMPRKPGRPRPLQTTKPPPRRRGHCRRRRRRPRQMLHPRSPPARSTTSRPIPTPSPKSGGERPSRSAGPGSGSRATSRVTRVSRSGPGHPSRWSPARTLPSPRTTNWTASSGPLTRRKSRPTPPSRSRPLRTSARPRRPASSSSSWPTVAEREEPPRSSWGRMPTRPTPRTWPGPWARENPTESAAGPRWGAAWAPCPPPTPGRRRRKPCPSSKRRPRIPTCRSTPTPGGTGAPRTSESSMWGPGARSRTPRPASRPPCCATSFWSPGRRCGGRACKSGRTSTTTANPRSAATTSARTSA